MGPSRDPASDVRVPRRTTGIPPADALAFVGGACSPRCHASKADLRGSGFFPNPRHARVGWVGAVPEEKFRAVADAVRAAVKASGVTLDRGDFRAHLTLFRIRDPWPPACIEIFNGALRDYKSDPFTVDSVTLFSSELNPKGAIHTPLRTFALA